MNALQNIKPEVKYTIATSENILTIISKNSYVVFGFDKTQIVTTGAQNPLVQIGSYIEEQDAITFYKDKIIPYMIDFNISQLKDNKCGKLAFMLITSEDYYSNYF